MPARNAHQAYKQTGLYAVLVMVLSSRASADCASGPWREAFSPERCWLTPQGEIGMNCNDRLYSATCGMRMVAQSKAIGVGQMSARLKAAPGPGVVTSFYLSNNGGMYSDSKPWNEIDFEIFGKMATPNKSVVWTNLFTGLHVEHNQVINLPFDVSADFHTYTFDLSPTTVKYIVDGVVYRTIDISAWGDAVNAIKTANLRTYISVWGKTVADPQVGCNEFVNLQGKLDDNKGPFPLYARFVADWNPDPPTTTTVPPPKSCGPMDNDVDYVVSGAWTKLVGNVRSAGSCCTHCQSESRCMSYTWARDASQCWLKNGLPNGKKQKAGVVSGLPHHSKDMTVTTTSTTLPAPKGCGPQEEDTDYVTAGWFTTVNHVASADDCCTRCQAQSICKSYSWVASSKAEGVVKGQCWLKSALPDKKSAKVGVVSGLPWPKKRAGSAEEAETTSAVPEKHSIPKKASTTAAAALHRPESCGTHAKDVDYLVKSTWIRLIDDVSSAGLCCEQCSENSGCQSYTWVANQSQCWLKKGLPYRQSAKAGVVSGLPPQKDQVVDHTHHVDHRHHIVDRSRHVVSTTSKLRPPGVCGPQEEDTDYVVNASWFKQDESVHSAGACCALCQSEAECKSYSFVKGAEVAGKFQDQCWLKSGLPDKKLKKHGVVSGLPRGGGSPKVDPLDSCGPIDKDIDYVVPQAWYKKIDHVSSAGACCAKCKDEMKCKSYTWVEDAKLPSGNPGQCWLKGGLPGQKALKDGVVSGLPGPRSGKSKDSNVVKLFATRPSTIVAAATSFFRTGAFGAFSAVLGTMLLGSVAVVLASRRLRSSGARDYQTLKHGSAEAAPLKSCVPEPDRV